MRISVKLDPWYDSDDEYYSENYQCNAQLETTEESDALAVLKMCVKAMEIEGYHLQSIVQCMYDLSDFLAYENNITIKKDEEDCMFNDMEDCK